MPKYTYVNHVYLGNLNQLSILFCIYFIFIKEKAGLNMSEIVTYSVKIDAEQRDLLQKKITESEMTAGTFLSAMLTNYEATQSRESLSDIMELKQLQNHLARIEEIYISLAKSRKDAEENQDHIVADLKEQLIAAKANLVDTQAIAKAEVESITKQLKELQKQIAKQREDYLLELTDAKEQKTAAEEGQRQAQKIASLTEQSFKQFQEQNIELKAKAELNQQKADQAVNELDKRTKELNLFHQEIIMLKGQLKTEKEDFTRCLKDQQHQSEIDKQKALLLAQQTALEKRESLQDEIVKLRDQLATELVAKSLILKNNLQDQFPKV